MKLRRLFVVTLAVGVLHARPAEAQDPGREAALALAREGQAALDRRDFAGALDRFGRAEGLFHAPTLLLGMARAQAGLDRWTAARETYARIAGETVAPGGSAPFRAALESAQREGADLARRMPSVVIDVKGAASPRVSIDDVALPAARVGVPQRVDPGEHHVRAEADGFAPVEATFRATPEKLGTVTLTFRASQADTPAAKPAEKAPRAAAAEPPPKPESRVAERSSPWGAQKTAGLSLLILGGAGVVAGSAAGGLAIAKHGDLVSQCGGSTCSTAHQSDVDTFHTEALVSTVALVAGGAVLTVGAILFGLAPKPAASEAKVRFVPALGLRQVGLAGEF